MAAEIPTVNALTWFLHDKGLVITKNSDLMKIFKRCAIGFNYYLCSILANLNANNFYLKSMNR